MQNLGKNYAHISIVISTRDLDSDNRESTVQGHSRAYRNSPTKVNLIEDGATAYINLRS